jgi:predicted naringenin-chalcone synthase
MTQDQATEMAQQICCETESQQQLLRVLYRRSGVKQRFTTLPHQIAYELAGEPVDALTRVAAAEGEATVNGEAASGGALLTSGRQPGSRPRGPTTGQRMEFFRAGAPPLALEAARKALNEAGCDSRSITHLITVSCTGFYAPGVDVALIEGLELARTVERIQVGFMGCHGAINGLQAADAIVRAWPDSRVLLCAVELCSLHYCFEWDPARAVGNAVFADGAAALVIESGDKPAAGSRDAWRLAATGSCLIPDSVEDMSWRIGDGGFEMYLSSTVPDTIKRHLRPWLTEWLGKQGMSISDVGSWAVHPGGPRILTAVEEALGLDRSATAVSREVLAECGNMSSPTVLFIVERLRAAGAARPCVTLGFGPGLTAEAALLV